MCDHCEILDGGEYVCINCGVVLGQEYVYDNKYSDIQIKNNKKPVKKC